MAELKEIKITCQEKWILAELQCTEMDEQHASNMRTRILEAHKESPKLPVVLVMSKAKFVPSLSLGALVTVQQTLQQKKQRLILVGLRPNIREIMVVCHLDKLFEMCDSIDEARIAISN
jgi:anti-anti-sigma factor